MNWIYLGLESGYILSMDWVIWGRVSFVMFIFLLVVSSISGVKIFKLNDKN